MFKRFLNWWLCLGEPKVLHKTKIEFFKKTKEAKIKHASVLWSLVKVLYPTNLRKKIYGKNDSLEKRYSISE